MEAQTISTKPDLWPAGTHAECACPHCGHIDKHQITNVRDWGLHARDGSCGACFGDYMVVAENGRIKAEKLPHDARNFLIHHHYDIGDQGITVNAPIGFNTRRAAIYMQFQAEEWFGNEKMVTNLGIAAALVTFYGCKHAARNSLGESIDMYADREAICHDASELMADRSLARDGLRDFLAAHLDG